MPKNISKDIEKAALQIKDVMQMNLATITDDMISQIMVNYRKSTPSTQINSTKNIKQRGVNKYKQEILASMSTVSFDAFQQVRTEVPAAKNVKLMENEERLLFGEFEKLPTAVQKRLKLSSQQLIGAQMADLEKAIFFQFGSSIVNTDSAKEIQADMEDKAEKYITGPAVTSGSTLNAANTVNEARNAFFFDDQVLEEIEAFQFMNGDPVSPICQWLAGKIFPKNHPNHLRFTPPLHYNCKSWIRPILTLKKSQKVEKLNPPKTAKESIQFRESFGEPFSESGCQCCGFDNSHKNPDYLK